MRLHGLPRTEATIFVVVCRLKAGLGDAGTRLRNSSQEVCYLNTRMTMYTKTHSLQASVTGQA